MASAAERIEELSRELHRHNHLYYVEARPEISDIQFDKLLKELEALEAANPSLARPDSPTQRVGGAPVPGLRSVKHKVPMLSIGNAYNTGDLRDFDSKVRKELKSEKVKYVVEPKIDGASVSLIYIDGVLTTAVTRGDGETGDDVTHTLKTAGGVPLRLRGKAPKHFEARGEVYITKADFAARNAELKAKGEKEAANPRNLAAGTVRMLDPKEAARRKLRVLAYSVGHVEGMAFKTQTEILEALKGFGFHVTPDICGFADIEGVIGCCKEWAEKRFTLPYDIDGLVIKVDDLKAREKLKSTAKHVKWAIAHKFEEEQAITKLLDIEIHVGKYGEQTPVARFEPVQLCGTTVEYSTLHNAAQVREKDIRIGDSIIVVKKGEIIPYVVGAIKETRTDAIKPFAFPKNCPSCGTAVKLNDSQEWRCPATFTCPKQLEGRLESFAKRERMDIAGMGETTAAALVAQGLVKSVADLYSLTEEQLLTLPGFGKKKAETLLKGIEASKGRGLGKLLGGLSIPNVGEEMGPLLSKSFPSLDAIVAASEAELAAVPGFGPVRAKSIKAYFGGAEGQALVAKLRAAGVKLTEDVKAPTGGAALFAGKTIVVTGTLVNFTRSTINARIESLGAKAGSSVSKNTDLVIVGTDAGSKLDRARELGVKVVTEEEFEAMIADLASAATAPPEEGPLAGKTVVVTGTLMKYDRRGIEALIEEKGGKAGSGVSKNTSFVVAGEDAGSKLAKARELGIEVIDEAEFERRVGVSR
ncbi:MAG: NAD-dependent DNA ligase LigA [Gemmataceae bacterium]|nr:NAD-dependent DNA ligase LigA [Gemmataceae bacterium]